MVYAITAIGPGFKSPSYHDYRGSLLTNAVHVARNYVNDLKKEWSVYGCSIILDGWTSRRQEPLINFLVYSPRGSMFLKSIDTLGLQKDKETLLEFFNDVVKEVGAENIVQFISDNDASYKATGTTLQNRILRKSRAALDVISLDNIDLLGEWVSEEPNLLDGDDFNWESIDAPFATMSISEEEEELVNVADADIPPSLIVQPASEETGDIHMAESPPDQDPFFYVYDVAD